MNLLADVRILVLKRGLEPLRAYRSLVPETSVSTNFTTSAHSTKFKSPTARFVSSKNNEFHSKIKLEELVKSGSQLILKHNDGGDQPN